MYSQLSFQAFILILIRVLTVLITANFPQVLIIGQFNYLLQRVIQGAFNDNISWFLVINRNPLEKNIFPRLLMGTRVRR